MRFRPGRFVAFAILSVISAAAFASDASPTRVAPNGELIDHVWAGAPIGFAMLTDRGYQFIAYYDADRRVTVAARKLGDAHWTRVQPPGIRHPKKSRVSNVTGWDSHNFLRLALDREGCLHLSGNMHVDPLVYYRTRLPFDVSTLERIDRMVGDREVRCTYPVFFRNAAGDLMFRYRDGQSGNGADIYNIYNVATRTWRRQLDTALLDGEGHRNAYASDPILGPDGRFHLAWVWRESPDCATNNTLSYARSRDFVHWENSRGQPLALPITRATGDVIDAAQPGEGLINMTFALGFDAEKRPIVVYHRYDAQHHSQVYAARPVGASLDDARHLQPAARQPAETNHWEVRQISDWNFTWAFSGGGSIPAEVTLGAPRPQPDGTLLVDFTTRAAGAGRWRLRQDTLERIAQLPAPPSAVPAELRRVTTPGMEVQLLISRYAGRRYVLRWETLPRNRDQPRAVAPAPRELRLYELPDAEGLNAERVGS